ncbi:NAD(P)-binding protein [Novosphingobium sp. FKTRR1]|uniref:NAD(P)-binding protein n=1 Tax=Novosphingobium sp. FKTRR1 TaxID=2879118 RepID=UPI001CEFE023|nr:NAD(P)-binding protein [Novosphingobium sp. FKTRR1]
MNNQNRNIGDDRKLGMDRAITRRDFVNGVAAGAGLLGAGLLGSGLPQFAFAEGGGVPLPLDPYPPARTGMRGSHPGAFEAAHALRDGTLKLADAVDSGEHYDLVIVGGGLSGLSAAHFFHKRVGPGARVLVLDNHDDFGGHAKRNEFTVNGRKLVVNGGTLNIESPARYDKWSRTLLDDLGVDLARYERDNAGNAKLYSSLGMGHGLVFDAETFGGKDVVLPLGGGWRGGKLDPAQLAKAPLTARTRADLARLFAADQPDFLPGLDATAKKDWLARHSYKQFLLEKVGVDPQVYWFFQTIGMASFCVGGDAVPALFAWVQGYPGFAGMALGEVPADLFADLPGGQHGRQREGDKSIHFPDGNATLARLLVAKLVPEATTGRTQEDMGTAVFDYTALDRPENSTRIRRSSVVVNVAHRGNPATAPDVAVRYVKDGKLTEVRGGAVILAGWNMMIPYLMPELPSAQKEALAYGVKGPLVYTSVAVTNWRAFHKLGAANFSCPTMFHQEVGLTEAVGLGELHHPQSPDEPVVLHLVKYANKPGLPRRDQHRLGRADLLAQSFADFERETRRQLQRILGGAGFDAARDIAAITVNRWPHGYAYTYNSIYDPVEWVYSESPDRPCVIGRQPFGLVSIANSDAAASPHTDAAIQEAHRAVQEVVERRTYPFVPRRVG